MVHIKTLLNFRRDFLAHRKLTIGGMYTQENDWIHMKLEVNILTSQLLTVLQENRKKHIEAFKEAYECYIEKVKQALKEQLRRIEEGKAPRIYFNDIFEPESHVADYDKAIRMVQSHHGETMRIDQDTYGKFVDDDWSWKRSFSESYTSNTRKSL